MLTGVAVGDAWAIAEFSGDADAVGFGVGDPWAAGVAAGVGVGLGIVGVAAGVAGTTVVAVTMGTETSFEGVVDGVHATNKSVKDRSEAKSNR